MTENTSASKKVFKSNEAKQLYLVRFGQGKRSIDGVDYFVEGFFNSGLYDIREMIFVPVENRIETLVWYTKQGQPAKYG